jgi:hypothetical protein
MPLITNDIEQARRAYASLEARAQAAEAHATTLAASLDAIRGQLPVLTEQGQLLRRSAIDNAAAVAQLQAQGIATVSPDVSLQGFVASLGLAAAIAEATMPDRAISSVSVSIQGHLVGGAPQDGARLRFHQPELGPANGLSSTSVTIEKVPPAAGSPTPRNLYVVLADKQAVYTNPFWLRQPPSGQIIGQIASVFANVGDWTFQLLAQSAGGIAGQEAALVSLLAAGTPAQNVDAYRTSVTALTGLTDALLAKSIPVAGDLLALAAALDRSTAEARKLVQ